MRSSRQAVPPTKGIMLDPVPRALTDYGGEHGTQAADREGRRGASAATRAAQLEEISDRSMEKALLELGVGLPKAGSIHPAPQH